MGFVIAGNGYVSCKPTFFFNTTDRTNQPLNVCSIYTDVPEAVNNHTRQAVLGLALEMICDKDTSLEGLRLVTADSMMQNLILVLNVELSQRQAINAQSNSEHTLTFY